MAGPVCRRRAAWAWLPAAELGSPVDLTYIPTLAAARDLYLMPRDMSRFQAYLRTLTGDTDDIELPLMAMNPMAREYALEAVAHLIDVGADAEGEAAMEDATQRLRGVPGALRATLVVSDDIGGMWTHRPSSELADRFGPHAFDRRGWSVAVTWTSDRLTRAGVRVVVLAAVYRTAHRLACGPAQDLGALLRQEARAARFAGLNPVPPTATAREVVPRLRSASDQPTVFAAWCGDLAAETLGYDPLGLDPGHALAVEMAERMDEDPVEALLRPQA